MSGKRKQDRRNRKNNPRTRLVYAASVLVLTALVGVAFFSPGWVFGIQDNKRCSETVLEERENADVAVLSTNYETSFYQRMINFAENQGSDTNYYVASEELTDYGQLQEFLESERGLYRDSFWILIEAQLIDEHIFDCEISDWKQYVIYSDDYTKGVNFILWYIELEYPEEDIGTYKLLLEADTGELYGLQADTGGAALMNLVKYSYTDNYYGREEYSLEEYLNYSSRSAYDEYWMILAYYYSGLTESDFFQYYDLYYSAVSGVYGNASIEDMDSYIAESDYAELNELRLKLGIEEADSNEEQWFDFLRTYPTMLVWDNGNRLECTFPYSDGRMIFRMQMAESVEYPWTLKNITVGFPAIYELIPEFGS